MGRCRWLQRLIVHTIYHLQSRNPKKYGHLRVRNPETIFGVRFSDRAQTQVRARRRGAQDRRVIGGGRQRADGSKVPDDPGDHPGCPGEAGRVLHPPRSSASGSSAKDRSATRSDSQRSHGRTRWDGHRTWRLKTAGLPRHPQRRRLEAGGRRTVPQGSDCGQSMWERPPSHD